jgi:hypothetical protein
MKKIFLSIIPILFVVIGFGQIQGTYSTDYNDSTLGRNGCSGVKPPTNKYPNIPNSSKCRCCGSSSNLEYDLIIPYSCGGSSSDVSNTQLLCLTCKKSKSNSCYCKVHNRKVGKNCCQNSSTPKSDNPYKRTSTNDKDKYYPNMDLLDD